MKGEWLVLLFEGLIICDVMVVGMVGFIVMLVVMVLEDYGLILDKGLVFVIGVVGGVGLVVVVILVNFGYEVYVVIGWESIWDYLKVFGVSVIVLCDDVVEIVKCLLEKEIWVGCVDVVGGLMLVWVLG